MITLGKFFGDKKSYGLLSNLFGFKSLLEALKENKFPEESTANPGTFKSSELVDAARLMLSFYKEAKLKEFAEKYQFEIVFVDNHIPKDVIPDNEAPLGKASNYSSNCPEFDDAIDIDENNKKL